MPSNIQETIKSIAILVNRKANENLLKMILIAEGYSKERAETILLWGKMRNKNEASQHNSSSEKCIDAKSSESRRTEGI